MMVKGVSSVNFKGYVPVSYYAKNPENGKYSRVIDRANIRKCNGYVVRNLNGTLKKNKNEEFVEFYKRRDADYAVCPVVHSVYDKDEPTVYLVSGKDADAVREMAKPVGRAKSDSIDRIGNSKSFESSNAANNFFRNVKAFLRSGCRRLKSQDGGNLSLRVYFDPKYNKKNEITKFNFVNARFIEDEK